MFVQIVLSSSFLPCRVFPETGNFSSVTLHFQMIFAILIRSWLLLFPLAPAVGLPDAQPNPGLSPGPGSADSGGNAAISILASCPPISILIPLSRCGCC